ISSGNLPAWSGHPGPWSLQSMTPWGHAPARSAAETLQGPPGRPINRPGLRSGAVDEGPTMEKLSQVLWRERELLETLLFKLEEEQTLLQSDRTRWLVRAAGEVDEVLETI